MLKAEESMSEQRVYAIQSSTPTPADHHRFMLEHMAANKAYVHAAARQGGDPGGVLLEQFRERYAWYRESWRGFPRRAVEDELHGEAFAATEQPPLCVDIELAAICELACPFCYRQSIATPDKIMPVELALRLIDQAADMGVPSMKFNWRGEPLLHPKLPQIVAYAKQKGILETIINTNAVALDQRTSLALIEAGLDLIIYSFDGGTRESYERLRPGRFKKNSFDAVCANIQAMSKTRRENGVLFPRTKIQMVLTRETYAEQESFFALFNDCVDDVSVKQYTERGGSIADLDARNREDLNRALSERHLPPDTPVMRDKDGLLYVSMGRLPCEQPFQRLLVTYDGRAAMCCYDWGAMHPVGYVDQAALDIGEREYRKVKSRADVKARGYERMHLKLPRLYNIPEPKIQTLQEIWVGKDIDHVRKQHILGRTQAVPVCNACPFKETYQWQLVK